MSFADIKQKMRRAIHGRLAVSCLYKDLDHPEGLALLPDSTTTLTVRFHTKIDRNGDLDGDYAEIIENVDRLVFLDSNVAEVSAALVENDEAPLVLARKAEITIPQYKNATFVLDTLEPPDGPLESVWLVARKRV